MIGFEAVTKEYRSPTVIKTILLNYSGVFPSGRNIGIIGANGAGKSTILRLISGTEAADSGKIMRTGRISFPLGFSGSFKRSLTGRENCRFVARIYGLPTKAMETFVESFCQLGGYFDMPISTYSSGMRSRLAFGVSMGIDFDCYLVDESLSVGDSMFRARAEAILEERRRTTNIIMVSHSPATLRKFCDMGFILAGGTLTEFDDINDAVGTYEQLVQRSMRRGGRRRETQGLTGGAGMSDMRNDKPWQPTVAKDNASVPPPPTQLSMDAPKGVSDDAAFRKLARGRRRGRMDEREDRQGREERSGQANVVQLALPPMPEPDPVKLRSRNLWLGISALVCIALPVIIASIYYLFFAADQYATEARFAVRSNNTQGADVIGVFSGMPSATVVSDSYILADYIRSIEMVKALEARIPLREIYSRRQGDYFVRLDPHVSIEKLVSYWQSRINPVYDATKNTLSIEVTAFTPEDTRTVLNAILEVSKNLVNNLSMQARQDAVKFAASEVLRAEQRVRDVNGQILTFRTEHNELDPTQSATASLGIASGLDSERSKLKSQLAAISGYLSTDAPSVQMLRSRINALDEESANVQERVSSSDAKLAKPGSSGALANAVGEYQDLILSQTFAEKAYEAAQGSLERARVEAGREQSYLAVYVAPAIPQDAIYPRAMINTIAVLLLSALAWGIGALLFLTVRDHIA